MKRVSIIMPTFNAERTIDLSLRSIRAQTFPQDRIEILVVDGGSSDRTRELALAAGAVVLPNPKTQQEYAKHIGLLAAKGDYAIFLDSDEVFANPEAIANRVKAFETLPEVRSVMSGGYEKPDGASSVNDYINIFSDPFAWFMYGTSSEHTRKVKSWSEHYQVELDDPKWTVFKMSAPLPLVDFCAGNSLDLAWLRANLAKELESEIVIPRLFYEIVEKTGITAVLKSDPIIHHSADSYSKFIKKIRWRTLVNIHYVRIPGTGFANREQYESPARRLKKYLFIPYALTGVGPFWASGVQFLRTGKPAVFVHAPLAFGCACMILYYYGLKIAGIRPRLKTYGAESKELAL